MATAPDSNASVKLLRGKQLMFTPPGVLGYNSLERPDQTYQKFQVNIHYTPAALEKLGQVVDEKCIKPLFAKWQEKFDPKQKLKTPNGADFVADKLKEPNNGKPFPAPFIRFQVAAGGKRKDQTEFTREMRAWSASNEILDLPGLKLGRGSIVQAAVMPGIFANALIKQPIPVFQLVGVRVLKLEKWGSGNIEAFDAEVLDVLGAEFEVEDLSAYAGTKKSATAEAPADDADESPF